jgi:hypothetical protein
MGARRAPVLNVSMRRVGGRSTPAQRTVDSSKTSTVPFNTALHATEHRCAWRRGGAVGPMSQCIGPHFNREVIMGRTGLAVALLCGLLASACGADRTAESIVGPSFSRGEGVSAAATGSGGFIQANGELRKFTFAATTYRDGRISGQFQLVAGNADLVAHGTVTCMTVIDNRAWIGGTLDRNSIGAPFTHAWWRAVDNSATGAPDEISLAAVANDPGGDLNRAFCDNTPAAPPLNTVTQGSITIR